MVDLVSIREVGLRDGLQLSKTRLSTETKLEWCKEQASIGFKEIEVTSFVPASILPQFSDALVVLKEAQKILHDEMSRSVVLNQLSLELKTQNVGETNEACFVTVIK